jgi:hypothetical protein
MTALLIVLGRQNELLNQNAASLAESNKNTTLVNNGCVEMSQSEARHGWLVYLSRDFPTLRLLSGTKRSLS